MTIASTNNQESYSGNGSTSVFPYNFKINDEDHLEVIIADTDGDETTLTITTHYTVSGVGEDSGGDVTTEDLTALVGEEHLPTGYTMVITRRVPLKQETDLGSQGPFYAQTIEDIKPHFIQVQRCQINAGRNPLQNIVVMLLLQCVQHFRQPDKNGAQLEPVAHLNIGQQSYLLKHFGAQTVGLIDNQNKPYRTGVHFPRQMLEADQKIRFAVEILLQAETVGKIIEKIQFLHIRIRHGDHCG